MLAERQVCGRRYRPPQLVMGLEFVHGVVDVLNEGGMHEPLRAVVGVSHEVGVAH